MNFMVSLTEYIVWTAARWRRVDSRHRAAMWLRAVKTTRFSSPSLANCGWASEI